ncbi:MAG: RNA methyltransferase, partial [Opitutales bacterium]
MEDAYIQSRHNEQIKNLVKLRERKYRDRQERFLVEGLRELSHALQAGYAIENLYYCPEHFPTEA